MTLTQYLLWAMELFSSLFYNNSSEIRVFRALNSNVHVVPNFLPPDLAMEWRTTMKEIWQNSSSVEANNTNNETCSEDQQQWLYATNNPGVFPSGTINNGKVRSLDNIQERNSTARQMKQAGLFSYAKWELTPNHKLFREMEDVLGSEQIRNKVTTVIQKDDPNAKLLPQLADMFVTLFSSGDFLSPHDDDNMGTWAFVISLMDAADDWKPEHGGGLHFECPSNDYYAEGTLQLPYAWQQNEIKWCQVLYPTFNTAVLFRTRSQPRGPSHFVESVSWKAQQANQYRFGITGWYMDAADVMSESTKREQKLSRARD